MSDMTGDVIVIGREELDDAAIDEALTRQRVAGPSALEPIAENRWRRILYANWFYLALAGALGAFVAWAVIEPYFDDGISVEGRISDITDTPNANDARFATIAGVKMLVFEATLVRAAGPGQTRLSLDDLQSDAPVRVLMAPEQITVPASGEKLWVAAAIEVFPADTAVPHNVELMAILARRSSASLLLFPWVAALIGLAVGAVEGLICRTLKRAIKSGLIGFVTGLLGGTAMALFGNLIYVSLSPGLEPTGDLPSFVIQMVRRAIAWSLIGSAAGIAQGIALKNRRLFINGLVGGALGGMVGGLLFDPISLLLPSSDPFRGAAYSRGVGLILIGALVGLMIGMTDLMSRTAWLRVIAGPLRGKEFSFVQTPVRLGSSPRNEIYLFKDLKIAPLHATIDKLRDTYAVTDADSETGTFVNNAKVRTTRLRPGDRIRIGASEFVYTTREKRV